MKKYNLLYIGCLTAALSITSCDVDLLNIPQEGRLLLYITLSGILILAILIGSIVMDFI